MDELGPMDFFSEKDRLAVVGQMEMQERASCNIVAYFRAAQAELRNQGVEPEDPRMRQLDRGIAAAEAKAEEAAREISSWERLR